MTIVSLKKKKILTVWYKLKINTNKVPEKRWGSLSARKQNNVLAVTETELWFQLEGPLSRACPKYCYNQARHGYAGIRQLFQLQYILTDCFDSGKKMSYFH